MILDLEKFVREERPYWDELDARLQREQPVSDLASARRLYYLYRRAASDLARLDTLATEPAMRGYLEQLVGRAYAEVHGARKRPYALRPLHWLRVTLPSTFRRHARAFQLATLITLIGALFGAGAVLLDPDAKGVIMPFSHLLGDPSDRVAMEEAAAQESDARPAHSSFAAMLMTNNIRVSILAMAFGIAWGLGTAVMLFYNGVILGAVMLDYIRAGEGVFLAGWLLPHGSIEIPAILFAGQAGFILGGAVIGRGTAQTLRERMRESGPDIVTLIAGVGLFLIWAGLIESFFSQYHAPVFPYWLKISFGLVELVLLFAYLGLSGRQYGGENGRVA